MYAKHLLSGLLLVGSLFHATIALSQSASADTPGMPEGRAGERAAALLSALNSGDPAAITQFLESHCTESFLKMVPMEEHVQIFMNTRRTSGGLDFYSVRTYTPERPGTTLILKDRLLGAWQGCTLFFEGPDMKIAGINLGPARPPQGVGQPESARTEAEMLNLLRAKLPELVEKDVFSGAILVARGDTVLFEYVGGEASKVWHALNTVDTRFNLGSMNKMFTATAVLQLVEQGLVALDDPISKYVDTSWLPRSVTDRVQVVHLLTHTSGLGSYFNDTYAKSSRDLFRAVDDYKSLVQGDTLAFEPGAQFGYSNTGMLLLGVVIEKASGEDYFDYVRKHIYEPAGMRRTDCYELDRPVDNLAEGYIPQADGGWKNNIFLHVLKGGPAGGGYSTVRDLHRFAQALLNGKLVTAATLEKMWTDFSGWGYGFGFGVQETPKGLVAGHGGGFPGLNGSLDIFRDSGYVVVVLSNYDMGAEGVTDYIRNLLLGLD